MAKEKSVTDKDQRIAAGERIAKRLARAGVASRRDAEVMIGEGRVSVNGKILDSPAFNVLDSDRIDVDGKPIPAIERTRLFLFHKPSGVVTTTRDPEGRKTVFDLVPDELPRLLAIGRLDIATEGLLLLTNDGGLSRVLELPATGWLRRYRVRVHGAPDEAKLSALSDGIAIDGVFYGAVEASIDRIQGSNAWLTIGIREGKNREVRRILEHLGLTVNRLIRVSYGPFHLGELESGAIQEIRARVLREQLGQKLIEESGANFDAPVNTPLSRKKPENLATKPEVERKSGKLDKRERALDRLQTREPGEKSRRTKSDPDRNRSTHVWMAPGARPKGPKKAAEAETRRYAGKGSTKPKPSGKSIKDAGKKPAQQSSKQKTRSQNWKAKNSADRRR